MATEPEATTGAPGSAGGPESPKGSAKTPAKFSARMIAGVIGAGVLVVLIAQQTMARAPINDGGQPPVPSSRRATAQQAIGAFQVKDIDGRVVPLVTPGEPSIVMVNSQTCGWCKRALKDIGEIADGRPVRHFKVLTLEGAGAGVPMLARERIKGAQLIGPAGESDQVLLTFRYPGTPTFVAIDRQGRVTHTMPGYPIRDIMVQWVSVMLGERDSP